MSHAAVIMSGGGGSHGKIFEAYVQNRTPEAYRVFWCYGPGKAQITVSAITEHP